MGSERTPMSTELKELIAAVNRLSDALATRRPDLHDHRDLVHSLETVATVIEGFKPLPEHPDLPAHWPSIPRMHPDERGLTPMIQDIEETTRTMRGRLHFSPRFGGTAAVHGGALSLLFDDALGRLANTDPAGGLARTAYLHVSFRRLAPIDTTLDLNAWVVRTERRKLFLAGELRHDGVVLTEAEGLWVLPRS